MSFLNLPDELLIYCFNDLDLLSAKAVRLTCKRFAHSASERVFSRLVLAPTAKSVHKFLCLLETKHLLPLVETISFQPWRAEPWKLHAEDRGKNRSLRRSYEVDDDDDDDYPHNIPNSSTMKREYGSDFTCSWDKKELSTRFGQALSRVGLFINLKRFEIIHHDWNSTTRLRPSLWDGDYSNSYRDMMAYKVFKALNHWEHPATKLRSLAFKNLHNEVPVDLLASNDFKAVESHLESLELDIVDYELNEHIAMDGARWYKYLIATPERHRFFTTHLPKFWLRPIQHQLVHLKLYSNCYWGYFPQCDLRGLILPRLKSLALNKMTFTHDWQVDWIIQHHATLTLLSLDNCPIVHDIFIPEDLNSEGYPDVDSDDVRFDDELDWGGNIDLSQGLKHRTYDTRWHEILRRLKCGLPHLRHFGFEHGADDTGCPKVKSELNRFHYGDVPDGWPGPYDNIQYEPADVYSVPEDPGRRSPRFIAPRPGNDPAHDKPLPLKRIHVDFASGTSASTLSLPAKLHPYRYIMFSTATKWQTEWIKPWGWVDRAGCQYTYSDVPIDYDNPVYPECLKEDQEALDELLEAVNNRR